MVNSYLNVANHDWCTRTNANEKMENITVVIGTDGYSLPVDFIRDVAVVYNGKPLVRRDMRDRPNYDNTVTGVPEAYWTWGGQVYLYPTPNAVETCVIYYTASPAALAQDTDAPGWNPAAYHKALAYHAVHLAKGAEGAGDAATFWLSQYERQVQEYQTYKANPTLARGTRIRTKE
jgi:hypothetical protein